MSRLAPLALLLLMAWLTGCAGQPVPTPVPKPSGHSWGLEGRPGPVTGAGETPLTREEVLDLTGRFAALRVWEQVALETARNEPENFHRAMMTDPPRQCVDEHRARMLERPDPPRELLLECARREFLRAGETPWESLGDGEREARIRRSLEFMFRSLDPPTLVNAEIARRRAMDVNPQNNAQFARFAAMYDECEELVGWYAELLLNDGDPPGMAETWLIAREDVEACCNAVTQRIFVLGETPDAD